MPSEGPNMAKSFIFVKKLKTYGRDIKRSPATFMMGLFSNII